MPDITPLPMPNPGVPYAIIGMAYDIVDDTNRSVPISELYMHHWLVYDTPTTGSGFNIGCGGEGTFVSNVYGAGAVMRGIDYAYTPGHGYVSKTGHQFWSANLHFINTEDLSSDYFNGSHGAAVKSCINASTLQANPLRAGQVSMEAQFLGVAPLTPGALSITHRTSQRKTIT